MTIVVKPLTAYRILVLHDGHSRKIVRSPFQHAQILGPDYKPSCKCGRPHCREEHQKVHAAIDDSGLRIVFTTALTAHRLEQIFVVKGGIFAPRFKTEVEGVKEVEGRRFLAEIAFVATAAQKRDLESAYRDWSNIEICVVPDLYERLVDGRSLTNSVHDDSPTLNEQGSLQSSLAAYSIPQRLFSWL